MLKEDLLQYQHRLRGEISRNRDLRLANESLKRLLEKMKERGMSSGGLLRYGGTTTTTTTATTINTPSAAELRASNRLSQKPVTASVRGL